MKTSTATILLIFLVVLLDQWLKIHIKLNYEYGQEYRFFGSEKAMLKFVENPGMAFGMEFGGSWGKIALSVFRIFMVSALSWYIYSLLKMKFNKWYIFCIALIAAGAVGNILDSAFYGLLFSESTYHSVAEFVPFAEEAYGSFLHGKVVDMFYFPMADITIPAWVPYFGGSNFMFFSFIFNIADAAITVGLVSILLFNKWLLPETVEKDAEVTPENKPTEDESIDLDADERSVRKNSGENDEFQEVDMPEKKD